MGIQRNAAALATATFLVLCGAIHGRSTAAEIKNSACLECHSDKTLTTTNAAGKEVSLFVDEAKLAASVHKTNTCASCHADITSKHPDDNVPAKPPACAGCHEKQSESYGASVHGLAAAKGQKGSATCSDCHDGHTILPPTSPASPLHFSRLAETCGALPRPGGQGRGRKRSRQGRRRRAPRSAHLHRLPLGTQDHRAQERFAAPNRRRDLQPAATPPSA